MADDPRSVPLQLYERLSNGDLSVIDELAADDVIEHDEFPGLEQNKDGVKQFFTMLREAFPDLRMTPHETIAEGDMVSVRYTATGTHRGEFMGVPATGNSVEMEGIDLFRIRDGQVAEHWGVSDVMSLMQQIGAIPDEAPA